MKDLAGAGQAQVIRMTPTVISTIELRYQQDVVLARQRARQVAELLGFHSREHTRIATAVSEIARNAFEYGGGGCARFLLEEGSPPLLTVCIEDQGKGIANLPAILSGEYRSASGMGLGIVGARRLMDRFAIESEPGRGVCVRMSKEIPAGDAPWTGARAAVLARDLEQQPAGSPFEEVQQQNQELLRALEEGSRLNAELEATNRGVVALYAELDEHAGYLRRANELKTSFLSNMSHEFRTPLNAIEGISRLLLERADGPLSPEQEKQVSLIRGAAHDLSELVNDLLDLAKIESDKVSVQVERFEVAGLFDSLRAMLRPLLAHNTSVDLVFEPAAVLPEMKTDEHKIAHILRNFISNALKFTLKGEVRVSACAGPGDTIVFTVADTGIGISPEDQQRIFEEFVQVEGHHQRGLRGTGLGLSLCLKLSTLLYGSVSVASEPGAGSRFSLVVPRVYPPALVDDEDAAGLYQAPGDKSGRRLAKSKRAPVLVVEDNRETNFLYEKYLEHSPYEIIQAHRLPDASAALRQERPRAIILDVLLGRQNTWEFLADLKADETTRDIPVILITVVDNERKAFSMGADAFGIKPVGKTWLLETLQRFAPVETQTTSCSDAGSAGPDSLGTDSLGTDSAGGQTPQGDDRV